jgi:hypothetical protein
MKRHKELADNAGKSPIERPLFNVGQLLEDEDLNASVTYTLELMRLMFRSLFGCGVICGLDVHARLTCAGRTLTVEVSPGLALDCLGNPIHVPSSVSTHYEMPCDIPNAVWVALYYEEKSFRPKDVSCNADEAPQNVYTRKAHGFRIKLYDQQPECACSCAPKVAQAAQGPAHKCCDDKQKPAETKPASTSTTPAPAAPSAVTVAANGGDKGSAGHSVETSPAATALADQLLWACYGAHHKGECGCECGASCVLLGVVRLPKPIPTSESDNHAIILKPDMSMRRSIRPVLTGYFHYEDPTPPSPEHAGGASPAK